MELDLVQEITRQVTLDMSREGSVRSRVTDAVQAADEAITCSPWLSPVTYNTVDINEAPDKPRFDCRKVRVRLTVMGAGDAVLRVNEGLKALNTVRAQRLVQEAIAQGGILSQQDLAFLLGTSLENIADILAGFDEQGQSLPYRRENHA
jgi:hypothetical protein